MIFAGDTKFSFYNNEFTGKNDIFDYKLWIPGSNRRASQFRLFFLYKYYGL